MIAKKRRIKGESLLKFFKLKEKNVQRNKEQLLNFLRKIIIYIK